MFPVMGIDLLIKNQSQCGSFLYEKFHKKSWSFL